ncbi:MAG: hypothetical protein GXO79_13355 [Chlorobi bacterium]|nr:hypothetical protein [Chlorobiota bacterium]
MKNIALLIIFGLILKNGYTQFNNLNIENDIVKSEKRIWKDFYYRKTVEKKSPLIGIKQTVIKEVSYSGDTKYTIYDNISLNSKSFDLEKTVYMIIDEKVFPLDAFFYENSRKASISENTKTIMTADSTNTTVVTGYTQDYWKFAKISYELNQEIINKITKSDDIRFRYYTGPRMITIKLSKNDIKNLKKIILYK